jgi:YegS/Rv2252/BmrU family lipid kinase
MMTRIQIIINPASGQDQPILNTLNSVFHPAGIDWDISITKAAGDARRFAAQAVDAGVDVVAIYGGDGSVMEAASGLIGAQTPLAILPGGTANVFSVAMGIPKDLRKAAELALLALQAAPGYQIRPVDLGLVNESDYFILRLGTGFEAEQDNLTTRELKDKWGKLAYTLAGIKVAMNLPVSHYRFTIDGELQEADGFSCMVANTASLGLPGVDLAKGVDVGDGYLDVVVFEPKLRDTLAKILSFDVTRPVSEIRNELDAMKVVKQWRAKEVTVSADPIQNVVLDGESMGNTPCTVRVVPAAVQVIAPAPLA